MTEAKEGKAAKPKIGVRRINEMSLAYQQAGTLWAAIELEIFTKISQDIDDLQEIAKALEIRPDTTDRLLTACVALGLLEQTDGRYRNAPDVDRFLVKGKPTYHGDWALYHKNSYEQWKNLAAVLKPPKSYYDKLRDDPKAARELTMAGYHSSIRSGQKFARESDLSSHSLLLDLGGGSGVYSIMACRQYPNLKAIVWDFPTILAVAEEFISEAGLSERIKTCSGDYLTGDYPEGVDVILICGTLEPRPIEEQQMVLQKTFDSLPTGGQLIFITNMLEDDKSGPLEAVCSNLGNVFGPEPWGRINSVGEIRQFLESAGFEDIVFSDFAPGTYRKVTARKP